MVRDAIFWKVVSGELPTSPAATLLGWKFLDYDEAARRIHVAFDANHALTNPVGNIQGGLLSAMLDDCMGPAIYAGLPPDRIAVTIESKTSFVNAAVPGRILGCGQIEHSKGSIAFTSGWLSDESGKVLARATATFRVGNLRWKGLAIPRGLARHMVARRLRAARTA